MYVLSWRTVYALIRVLFLCLFSSLLHLYIIKKYEAKQRWYVMSVLYNEKVPGFSDATPSGIKAIIAISLQSILW